MTKRLLLLLLIAITSMEGMAQETIALNTGDITSPKLNADGTATFSILAPEAQKVEIEGDFTPVQKIQTPMGEMEQPGRVALKKDANGIWTWTSGILQPELHTYSLYVDGVRMNDPNNVYMLRDIASYQSLFPCGRQSLRELFREEREAWNRQQGMVSCP